VPELEQKLEAMSHIDALPQLRRLLTAYAKKKLNKKYYKKVTIRGPKAKAAPRPAPRKRRRAFSVGHYAYRTRKAHRKQPVLRKSKSHAK
jgi:hypothetical protein